MRVGLNLPQYAIDFMSGRADPAALLRLAGEAESRGIDSVWLSDHPYAVGPDGTVYGALDPVVMLGALAASTCRATLGTLVLSASTRRSDEFAADCVSLSRLAPGRVLVGVGAGWNRRTHAAFGIPFVPYSSRVAHLRALLEAARERPRLLVGGASDDILAVAAEYGDAWNVAWDVPAGAFAAASRRLDAACERVGRDPAEVERSVGVTVLLGESEAERRRRVARVASRAPFLAGLTVERVSAGCVSGSVAQVAERLAEYEAEFVVATLFERDDPEGTAALGEVARRLGELGTR